MQCPRCNAQNSPQARFCMSCGLQIPQAAPVSAIPPPPQPNIPAPPITPPYDNSAASLPVQPSPSAALQAVQYPYSAMSGYSVLKAMGNHKPANALFWVGLIVLVGNLLICPCFVGLMLLGSDPADVESADTFRATTFLVAGCLFAAFIVIGIALIAAGRPRKLA
ncbi:MAG TPA: zinc ribbon domain-containing protein [Chloroflexia bacterium]|nr:zinc ribbon domain-containing protein [Chloroflexia bacterium]